MCIIKARYKYEKWICNYNDDLKNRGLDLNDYALDGTLIPSIINDALDLLITRICYLNDSLNGEEDIEKYIDENPTKLNAFLKAQYRMIYNLIFMSEKDPRDNMIDDIVVYEMKLGKINGFQKGLFRR